MDFFNHLSKRSFGGLMMILFLIVASIVYGHVLSFDFVNFDDNLLVYENGAVLHPFSLSSSLWALTHFDPELYIPLTFFSYMIDSAVWGMDPFGFHLTGLLLHIGNALLLAWICILLFEHRVLGALMGLLFLVHPLNTEAAVWISGRKDVLSTLFLFSSIIFYLQYKDGGRILYRRLLLFSFILGLLSKVTVAPLPLLLLLLDYREHGRITKEDIRSKWDLLVAAALFGIIALFGKDIVLARLSLWQTVLLSSWSTMFYLYKFIVPFDLSIFYLVDPTRISFTNLSITLSTIFVAITFFLLLFSFQSRRGIVCFALIFFLMLLPSYVHTFKGMEMSLATDRYMYVPMLGLLLLLLSILTALPRNILPIAQGGLILVIIFCGSLSHKQSQVWRTTETLFSHALLFNESAFIHEKLGTTFLQDKKYTKALYHLKESLSLKSNPDALYNLGILSREQGMQEQYIELMRETIRIGPEHPQAHINLGQYEWQQGNQEQAIDYTVRARELAPWNMMGLGNLATMYTLTGQYDEALEVIDAILALEPGNERVKPLLEKILE